MKAALRKKLERLSEQAASEGENAWTSCDDMSSTVFLLGRAEGLDIQYQEGEAEMSSTHPDDAGVWESDFHAWVLVEGEIFDPKMYISGKKKWKALYRNYRPYEIQSIPEE